MTAKAFRVFTGDEDRHPLGCTAEYLRAEEVHRHPWTVGEMYLVEAGGNFMSYPSFCELNPLQAAENSRSDSAER